MTTIRIAVASTPLTASLDEAVPAAISAIGEAGRLGARLVSMPETGLPGHRDQPRSVPGVTQEALDEAVLAVADAAREAGVVAIVGTERMTPAGREIVSIVIGADGRRLGEQVKTQIDPSEERWYVPGTGRQVFTVDEMTFGIAICHEAFRYPEIARSLVLAGAQIVFVPHFVVTDDGFLPTRWGDAANPYNEKAVMLRALENGVYVAASNTAGPNQGSITGIIGPDGRLLTSVDYGQVGIAVADIDLDCADRWPAMRWSPERSVVPATSI